MDFKSAYIKDNIPKLLQGFENLEIRNDGVTIKKNYKLSTSVVMDEFFHDIVEEIKDTIMDSILKGDVENFKKIMSIDDINKGMIAFWPIASEKKHLSFCHNIVIPWLYHEFHKVKKYSLWDRLCLRHKRRLVFFAPQESCHIVFSKIQVKNNSGPEGVDVELYCSLSATIEDISYMELR